MREGEDTTELERRLAEVESLRRRVLNVIPHALRTPITTFRGLAEALPAATEDEIRLEIAPALRRLAAQAEHLLDDMLIAAGYTTTLPTGTPEATPVGPTARTVWNELTGGDGGAAGHLDVAADDHLAVLAPTGSLFKVFVHVFDNAIKYGQAPTTLRAMRNGDSVVIEVASAGPPIVDLHMAFEPFYRGEQAVMSSAGLGVGLTVARALVEQAGGTLVVEPGPGDSGVVTRIDLPAKT